MRGLRHSAKLIAGLVLAATATLRAQVLNYVPEQSLVVVKFTNIQSVSEKFAKFCKDLGVDQMEPKLADPLGAVQAETKIQNGLDKAGDLALAFIDPAVTGGNPEKSAVILVPVSDYKAFIANFEGATTEGDVTSAKIGGDSDLTYIAAWGNYAALSPNQAVVQLKPKGLKISANTVAEARKDAFLYANIPLLKEKLGPDLQKGKAELLDTIQKEVAKNESVAKFSPVIKIAAEQAFAAADTFFRDTDGAAVSVNLVPEGLNFGIVSDFKAESYLGNLATSFKNSSEPLLAGLPAGKYLFFGGGTSAAPEVTSKLMDDLVGPVLAELEKAGGPQAEAAKKYYASLKATTSLTKGSTVGLLAPAGNLGAEPIFQFLVLQKGESAGLKKAQGDMATAQEELMKSFELPNQTKTTITPNTKTVGETKFDLIKTEPGGDPNGPEAAQMAQMMKMLYGPEGAAMVYSGEVAGKGLLMFSGVGDDVAAKAITDFKAGTDVLSTSEIVKPVSAQLPASKLAVAFIPLGDIASTGVNYAKMTVMPNLNIQLPPDLPPIGIAISTQASALRIDEHVPTSLISALVSAFIQAQMQGGGNRGGGL